MAVIRKERKSNFELLRIVSMLMIIMYHIIYHGNAFSNSANINFTFIIQIIEFLVIIHVNLFILITGYFQVDSKFKMSKVLRNFIQTIFYSVVIMVILILTKQVFLTKVDIIRHIFLIENSWQYWFIKIYIMLYCFSPFLNLLINNINKDKHKILLLSCFIIFSIVPYITGNKGLFVNDGFTLSNFIFLYLLGAYIKKYPITDKFKNLNTKKIRAITFSLYLFFSILNFCVYKTSISLVNNNSIFHYFFDNIIRETLHYENPIVIFQTISFFLFFETINIKSRVINVIGKTVFGIYLLHEHSLIQPKIYKWLRIDSGKIYSTKFIFYMLLIMIVIFIGGTIIELIRQFIFNFIYKRKISFKIRKKIKNNFKELGFNINW